MTDLVYRLVDTTNYDKTVPVTQGDATCWALLHTVDMPPLLKGDLLDVRATCEIRNDAGYNVEFVKGLILSPGWVPNDVNEIDGSIQLVPLAGTDHDPSSHYDNPHISTTYQMTDDLPSPCIQFRIRCRSTAATGNEACSIMQPDYSFLQVDVWRGVPMP